MFHKKSVTLEVLDTVGTEQFTAMRDLYMKHGAAFLVLYSVCSKLSFDRVSEILEKLYSVNDWEPMQLQFSKPIIIVGNKVDLSPKLREVSYQDGYDLAEKWHAGFVETSAKTKFNVEILFRTLAELQMTFRC
jgi:small GTP-binding protein